MATNDDVSEIIKTPLHPGAVSGPDPDGQRPSEPSSLGFGEVFNDVSWRPRSHDWSHPD
jgi:hypothetical protein